MKLRANNFGFSMIELLVVVGLLALLMGLATTFFSPRSDREIRKFLTEIVGTVRYAYNDAARKNATFRIVWDFESKSFWLESTGEEVSVKNEADLDKKKKAKKEPVKKEAGVDEAPPSEDGADEPAEAFTAEETRIIKKRKLPDDFKFKDIYVSHQEKEIDSGVAYLYFLPTGSTEEAVINICDEEEKIFFSLIVNPVTGRVSIEQEYQKYDQLDL